jgi:formate-dependent nitrite reductase membrane component NrfD
MFGHLLHHAAVINVLNQLILLKKPDVWIAWGTHFIIWMMVWGMPYALPYACATPFYQRMPVVNRVIKWYLVKRTRDLVYKYRKLVGGMAVINGVGVAVYTGLLLQSFPAVALRASPGVPLLFTNFGGLFGFTGFGLIVPFFLELKGVIKGWNSHAPIIAASVFVLVGGYLLRHYFIYAGVYAYPW